MYDYSNCVAEQRTMNDYAVGEYEVEVEDNLALPNKASQQITTY